MNVFHKLTIESLKKNKTRTIVTIIGIILSTAMICAVASLSSSFHSYLNDFVSYEKGSWHIKLEETNNVNAQKIIDDSRTKKAVYSKELGYANFKINESDENLLYVMAGSNGFSDVMPVHMIKGHYPQSSNEIILPSHLSYKNYKLGDKITLELGKRFYNGKELHQSSDVILADHRDSGESFVPTEKRTFTIVGIYERPVFESYDAPGYTAITVLSEELNKNDTVSVWAELKNPLNALKMCEDINGCVYNKTIMQLYGFGFDQSSNMTNVFYGMLIIVLALIIFASVALIYNAFSISVSERTKQFGLLSSLGATKKQLRKMVNFEALVLSCVGIPIGIGAGLLGIFITLKLVGDKIASFLGNEDVLLTFNVHPIFVLAAVLLSFLTIFISVYKPSIRATKVSAIEAIRQSKDIKIKNHNFKTPKWVYKLYGLPGVLAQKNYKRSAKKYRTTVISLSMSIIIFISVFSFTSYLLKTVDHESGWSCDIIISFVNNRSSDVTKARETFNSVREINTVDESLFFVSNHWDDALNPHIIFVDDNNFKNLLKENYLSEKEYMKKDSPKALIYRSIIDGKKTTDGLDEWITEGASVGINSIRKLDDYSYGFLCSDDEGKHYVQYQNEKGDKIKKASIKEACEKRTITAGKEIKNLSVTLKRYIDRNAALILPLSSIENVYVSNSYTIMDLTKEISIFSDDYIKCEKDIREKLNVAEDESAIITGISIHNAAKEMNSIKNMILVIRIFCYGFVALLTLISAANIFNTITTNISLRRREFAMLQSIGMTQKEIKRMMRFECMKYGLTSLLIGVPISLLITLLIHMVVTREFDVAFLVPFVPITICALGIFLLVFSTMSYAMRKINDQNTIETLKDENQ